MKLYSLCANIEWKFAHKWGLIWFSQTRKDPLSYHTSEITKCCKKIFDLSMFKFQNGLKPRKYISGAFLRKTAALQPNHKKCVIIFADYKPCTKYRDFGTSVRILSKRNGGLIFFTFFSSQSYVDNQKSRLGHPKQLLFYLECSIPWSKYLI